MPYSTRTDLETLFGKENILKWADLNNNGDLMEIQTRVDRAISVADERIDSRLRNNQYVLPLDPVPLMVTDASARLASYWLYTSRGIIDPDDTSMNQLQMHKGMAEQIISDLQTERVALDSATYARKDNTVTYPTVEEGL